MNLQKDFMQTDGQQSQKSQPHFLKIYIFCKMQRKNLFLHLWGFSFLFLVLLAR